ncbi:hypothetical protein GW17_00054928 [Ensete ventricosum]|nr:hypothetical protein GW17_00054928 [Ensete ventricosum]
MRLPKEDRETRRWRFWRLSECGSEKVLVAVTPASTTTAPSSTEVALILTFLPLLPTPSHVSAASFLLPCFLILVGPSCSPNPITPVLPLPRRTCCLSDPATPLLPLPHRTLLPTPNFSSTLLYSSSPDRYPFLHPRHVTEGCSPSSSLHLQCCPTASFIILQPHLVAAT